METEAALIRAIELQDKQAFELLYKTHYKQLFAVAYRYVGKSESAEEVVHDVFINIWNKAAQIKIQHSIKSYLVKAVVNTSLNVIKKEKLAAGKRLKYMAEQTTYDHDEGNHAAEEALLAGLESALNLLPEKCRNVMYLSRFGKLKQEEIADQLNISIKTVKNHLTYGFQKLREHLELHKTSITLFLLLLTRIKF
ncbi:putative RNA polymerase sigma factor [Pedobacter sp. BAL39]|uniref:RNA polymerase sigma factor n=1 Tax=Pedobacter sp. BAL39 TaxID=391596 RepID=UPI0001559648|nr:RNA polymerase sigma-70 factor [Pedobacter sp. BAL39]EDM36181.1 putative RNA polymerase sigma factor [Pedobacter sp. BAL39]